MIRLENETALCYSWDFFVYTIASAALFFFFTTGLLYAELCAGCEAKYRRQLGLIKRKAPVIKIYRGFPCPELKFQLTGYQYIAIEVCQLRINAKKRFSTTYTGTFSLS